MSEKNEWRDTQISESATTEKEKMIEGLEKYYPSSESLSVGSWCPERKLTATSKDGLDFWQKQAILEQSIDKKFGVVSNGIGTTIANLIDGTPVVLDGGGGMSSLGSVHSISKVAYGSEAIGCIATESGWKSAKEVIGEEAYNARQDLYDRFHNALPKTDEWQLVERHFEGMNHNFQPTAIDKQGVKIPEHDSEELILGDSRYRALLSNGKLIGFQREWGTAANWGLLFLPVNQELQELWGKTKY